MRYTSLGSQSEEACSMRKRYALRDDQLKQVPAFA